MMKKISLCLILCLVMGMATACAKESPKSEGNSAQGVLPLKTGILARSYSHTYENGKNTIYMEM